ncbi:MAG: alpha/beta hydrolase [Sphingorhabdus sp.]
MIFVEPTPDYVTRPDGVRLAYRYVAGTGPAIVFLPGYMSDMQGGKAQALTAWAQQEGRAMLRLDYSGCGESGGRIDDGTLEIWRDDVLRVIDHLGLAAVILVGSSMGGWLMLLVAGRLGNSLKGLVGIAAAPDFTDWGFSDTEKSELLAQGFVERPSGYGYDPMVTTRKFWQSGEANKQLGREIPIGCPVRLLHGQRDPDVPWEISLKLAQQLRSSDVQTILLKDGDHRLSRNEDIALLIEVVAKLPV